MRKVENGFTVDLNKKLKSFFQNIDRFSRLIGTLEICNCLS